MNKFFIVSAAALALVGCSSNDEVLDLDKPVKIVDATIGIGMGESVTRAYLGEVTIDEGAYTISHIFQKNDEMYITDYSGQYPFTVGKNGQTTVISGRWAEIDEENPERNGILATFPMSAVKGKATVDGGKPTMYFTLPTEQTSYVYNGNPNNPQLSYDRNAGLAFACNDNKTANIWFLPLVSYLYFYSKEATCTISSNVNIAGDYTVTYSGSYGTGTNTQGTDYNTAEGLSQFLTYTATANSIVCHGQQISTHQNAFAGVGNGELGYEYIIALKPGSYTEKSLWVTPENATKSCKLPAITMIPSDIYYIGCVDAPAN